MDALVYLLVVRRHRNEEFHFLNKEAPGTNLASSGADIMQARSIIMSNVPATIIALKHIGGPIAAMQLVALALEYRDNHDHSEFSEQAVKVLLSLNEDGSKAIAQSGSLSLLHSRWGDDDSTRLEKIAALGRIGGPEAIPALIAFLEKPETEVAAKIAIRGIGAGAIPALVAAFESQSASKTSISLARQLGCEISLLRQLGWKPESVVHKIRVAILERDRATLQSLGVEHTERVISEFHELWGTMVYGEESDFKAEVVANMLMHGNRELWRKYMKVPDWRRKLAIRAAAEYGGAELIDDLIGIFRQSEAFEFYHFIWTLADRFPNECKTPLVHVIGDASAAIGLRLHAAIWLLKIKESSVISAIPRLTIEALLETSKKGSIGGFGGCLYSTDKWIDQWSVATGIGDQIGLAVRSLRKNVGDLNGALRDAERREELTIDDVKHDIEGAAQALCGIRNAFSSAILEKISNRRDVIEGVESVQGGLIDVHADFSIMRRFIQEELARRQGDTDTIEEWYAKLVGGRGTAHTDVAISNGPEAGTVSGHKREGNHKITIRDAGSHDLDYFPFGCPGCEWDHFKDSNLGTPPLSVRGLGSGKAVWKCPNCCRGPHVIYEITVGKEEVTWSMNNGDGSHTIYRIGDCGRCGSWRSKYSLRGLGWHVNWCRCCGFHHSSG